MDAKIQYSIKCTLWKFYIVARTDFFRRACQAWKKFETLLEIVESTCISDRWIYSEKFFYQLMQGLGTPRGIVGENKNADLMWNRYTSSTKWSTISKIDILCTHGQFGRVFHMFWIGNDTFPLMISANTHFIEQSMNRVPSTGLIGWKKRRESHRNNNNS